jgi:hypothetical protein
VRELDERLGLSKLIEEHLVDSPTGRNRQFPLGDLLRQSGQINYEAVVLGNRPINEKTGTRISLFASASGNPSSVNRRNASVVSSS